MSESIGSISLPPASCSSRRPNVRVHVFAPEGEKLVRVSATIAGRRPRAIEGRRASVLEVQLRGLPRARYTLAVRAVTNRGRALRRTRHYVTCVGRGKAYG